LSSARQTTKHDRWVGAISRRARRHGDNSARLPLDCQHLGTGQPNFFATIANTVRFAAIAFLVRNPLGSLLGGSQMSVALAGRRIAVPETRELDVFAQMPERHGANVVRCPLVAIRDVPDPAPVVAWLRRFTSNFPDDFILLTGEGLERLVGFARRGCSLRRLLGCARSHAARNRCDDCEHWACRPIWPQSHPQRPELSRRFPMRTSLGAESRSSSMSDLKAKNSARMVSTPAPGPGDPLIRSGWQHRQTVDDRSRRPAGFRCAVWEKRRRTVCEHRLAIDI
jgi:hypothetical protein